MRSAARWDRILREDTRGRDAADLVRVVLGEPETSVRACSDGIRCCAAGGEDIPGVVHAGCRHDPDLPGAVLGEIDIARRADNYARRLAEVTRNRKLGDDAGWCDPTDVVAHVLREPEIAVRASCNPKWSAVPGEDRELGDRA